MIVIAWLIGQLLAAARGDHVATCPAGWSMDGVSADGWYRCLELPAAGVCDTRAGCDDVTPTLELVGRVRCAAGERAVMDDRQLPLTARCAKGSQ